jgi:Tol biopolymer transport system component
MGGTFRSSRIPVALSLCALLALALLTFAVVAPNQEEAEAAFPGANGRIAFANNPGSDVDIYSMNPDGSDVTQLTSSFDLNGEPVWSADGAQIAFFHLSLSPITVDIYVMNSDGSGLTNVTNGNIAEPGVPAWLPNGTQIGFIADDDIHVINVDGTGLTNITNSVAIEFEPAWSPDGSQIAYLQAGDIFVMNADGTGATQVSTHPDFEQQPAWSPDGTQIAFARSNGTTTDIFGISVDGTGETNVTSTASGAINERKPAWSPDGTKIAYERAGDIYTINSDGSSVTNVTSGSGGAEPDWQPNPSFPNSNIDLFVEFMKIELQTGGDCNFSSTNLGVSVIVSNHGTQASGSFVVDVNAAQQTVVGGLGPSSNIQLWFKGYEQFDPNVATVDAFQQVQEFDETNNTKSQTLAVPTLPPTCTPAATPTQTPTPTPKDPFADTDGDATPNGTDTDDDNDGCSDVQENGPDEKLGGRRNPHNPSDFYDVNGDLIIDLPNDILGVVFHYAPSGTEAVYDVTFDRGPSIGPNAWNMTAPDGVIDLSNDILGVVQQYQHSCQ